MKLRTLTNFGSPLAKIFGLMVAFLLVTSACNQADEEVAPAIEDMPSLTEALEAFDEEVEYMEFSNSGSEDARWGYKKWRRKPTFFTLVSALNYTGLLKTVIKEELTIFAPDDKAFAELGLNFWNIRYKVDKETLTEILLNHVASGFVFSSDLDCSVQTVANSTLRIVEKDGNIAFQDDSDEITNLLFADRRALRSVFHGIDKVLVLSEPDGTIADIAVAASQADMPEFTQLVAALTKANLVGAVADPEAELTVFAPTDAAFEALYNALPGVEGIDDLSVDILTRVLLHHVVGGRVFSNCLVSGEVPTLNQNITVDLSDLSITSSSGNKVGLVASALDIKGSNGVIHVIDGVLVPANYLEPLP